MRSSRWRRSDRQAEPVRQDRACSALTWWSGPAIAALTWPSVVPAPLDGVRPAALVPGPAATGKCPRPASATAGQPVAGDGGEVAPGELLDLLLAAALDHAGEAPRPPLRRGPDRGAHRRLAGGAPAALAARPLPAAAGVVDPDPAGGLGLPRLARRHRPRQPVLRRPGGALPHARPSSTGGTPPL